MSKNNFNDLFDFFDDLWGNVTFPMGGFHIYEEYNFPPMNLWIKEETKDVLLEFAIAGIPKENISINTEGDYLNFEIKKSDVSKEGFKLIKKSLSNASVKNRYYFPSSKYNLANIKADLKDGILKVFIPAREETKPKLIEIV